MKYLYLTVICFICSTGFAQEELIKEATTFLESNKVFKNYQKEKFFLHTNKTTYFSGEHINYKAYIVDDYSDEPSDITTNLHFSMYDYNGDLVSHQLVFVESGTVNGSLKLEKDLKSGTYFLVIDTYYNTSFNKKNISEIQVVNLLDKKTIATDEIELVDHIPVEERKGLQVAFFPESDVLLSKVNNTLYYKISLDGLPIDTKGELIKSGEGDVVGEFVSGKDGMGFINFNYDLDGEYYFKIRHNQETYKINVPIAQKEGFVIHHDSKKSNSKEASFTVKINKDTAVKNDNDIVLAVIHRNNSCRAVIPFKINKYLNNYLLNIKSENLFNGINVISLFNKKNEVLSSRYFFYDKNKNIELKIDKFKETKDSLTLDLKMPNNFIKANTSVSILPEQNVVNTNSKTIYTAFLISPYVSIDNKLKDIDLALQIASPKSDISNINKNVQIRDLENGISISGEVLADFPITTAYKVLLTSKENGVALIENVKSKNKFSFNNLLIYHPSKYDLALLNPTGKVVDAEFKVEEKHVQYPLDSIIELKHTPTKNVIKSLEKEANNEFDFVYEGEKLNEIVLSGKTRKEEKVNEYPDFGIIDEPGALGNGFTREIIKKEIECMGCTLFEYLDQFWNLRTSIDALGDAHVTFTTRGTNTFFGSAAALLIVNGLPVNSSILTDLWANDVKSVKLNRAGAGYGLRGSNGVILVELKKPEDYLNSETNNIQETKIFSSSTTFGFTKSGDMFKSDNLIFNSQETLEKYSTIDWIPNFILKPNSSNFITIPKESYTAIKLIINGINELGDIVSEEVSVTFN
ncbi:hypothetical protein [Bizionia arctica]|uniref:TonB-dependent receptor plug domain-containing protein n=1 Tax=Bizionia arctica TaxID=1495645 RepID=A0A917GAW0_9FLAO|nr:hypothetical protein [Bizionia arctica]GGG34171.1 hypothetical protein GCM10010976_02350 [Bizionia arctica]